MIAALTGLGYLFTEKKRNNRTILLYLSVTFLAFTFLTSFRYAIGFDYFSYRNIYETIAKWSFGDILHDHWHEPLYFIVCKIFNLSGCSFSVFLLSVNLFLIFAAMQFIYRYSKLPWISVYLYITFQFLAYNMNLIRQSIALAFFLFAYPYLRKQKPFPYVIWILLGGLFHNSLLIMLPFYFLWTRKITWHSLIGQITFVLFIYFFFDPFFHLLSPLLPKEYSNYQGSYFWNANSFSYVIPSIFYCFLLFLFRNRVAEPSLRSIYLNSALYYFLFSLLITKHFILERFAIYPFSLALIAVPEIINSFPKERNEKSRLDYRHILLLFLLFGGVYFFFAVSKGYHHVYPYVSLLDKSISTPD